MVMGTFKTPKGENQSDPYYVDLNWQEKQIAEALAAQDAETENLIADQKTRDRIAADKAQAKLDETRGIGPRRIDEILSELPILQQKTDNKE